MDCTTNAVNLFNFAVCFFDHIQLAREFEQNFATHQLRLDIIQIRLSRWGEAVGINKTTISAAESRDGDSDSPEKKVEGILETMQDALSKAQYDAQKAGPQTKAQQKELLEPEKFLPIHLTKLRRKLRESIEKRKTQAGNVCRSAQWAFYKKEHFGEFVSEISSCIDELEKLFPEETQKKLQILSKEECQGVSKSGLQELQAVGEKCDPWMRHAAEELLKPRDAETSITVTQTRNLGTTTGIHNGDVNGPSHTFNMGNS